MDMLFILYVLNVNQLCFKTRYTYQYLFDRSSSYTDLGTSVSVSYTAGEWTGTLSQDYISIGGASRILAHFVLITKANQFFLPNTEWEGILGMAYSSLAKVIINNTTCTVLGITLVLQK